MLELIEAYLEVYEVEPPTNSELTEDQKAELERRLADFVQNPEDRKDWEEVKPELRASIAQANREELVTIATEDLWK